MFFTHWTCFLMCASIHARWATLLKDHVVRTLFICKNTFLRYNYIWLLIRIYRNKWRWSKVDNKKESLPQNWGDLQLGGCPPAWEHCRENSDSVLQTQKSSELLLQLHMSWVQAWMKTAGLRCSVQELQESERNKSSQCLCYKGQKRTSDMQGILFLDKISTVKTRLIENLQTFCRPLLHS